MPITYGSEWLQFWIENRLSRGWMTARAKRQSLLAPTVISKYLDDQKNSPRRLHTVYPFNDNIPEEFKN